tara:strand:+ start:112 stop:519 length:408 start_codon:yes stop_codon:yes gene_type:complete
LANIFILNIAGTIAPMAADKNANRLIAAAVAAMGGEAPATVEPIDVEARRVALFGQVSTGEVSIDEATTALKALDAEVAAQAQAAKADPPIMLLAGEPASAAEVKRAFRGADDGTSVEVGALDGSTTGTITMFRV